MAGVPEIIAHPTSISSWCEPVIAIGGTALGAEGRAGRKELANGGRGGSERESEKIYGFFSISAVDLS